ncbi:membrane protein [Paenibacillus senegalensis]|uniref:membrane protein n=1 Tax=Paenibacillus senegalensis TaxID=1465766 RepID=UPI0002893E16|nr:membrane protein [Paenibacillus senegalensis]
MKENHLVSPLKNQPIPQDRIYRGRISSNQLFLIAAILVYAGFSVPFPANPGMVEAGIAVLLALFVTVPVSILVMAGGFSVYERLGLAPSWLHLGFFLLVWGQLFNGAVIHGWSVADMIRDLVPAIYIFLPLLLLPAMLRTSFSKWLKVLPYVISLAGVLLSLRFYMEVGIWPWELGGRHYFDNYLYLPYDPVVTFAGIFLPLMAVQSWNGRRPQRWLASLAMLTGGALALGSLMAVAQRAPLGLAAIGFVLYFFMLTYRSLGKMLVLLILAVSIGFLAQEQISSSIQLLSAKQEEVGANGKTEELKAVWSEVSRTPRTLLFGIGWGGLYESPAVEGQQVSFTHSALTFFLLKTGISGLVFFMFYLLWVARNGCSQWSLKTMPVLLASLVPILIGLFFQVSYKTLSFGVVLTIICLMQANRTERRDG